MVILFSGWSASQTLFQYLVDVRPVSYSLAPKAAFLFELGVPISMAIFAWVALSDPGKLPTRVEGHFCVGELMRDLDGGSPENGVDVSSSARRRGS